MEEERNRPRSEVHYQPFTGICLTDTFQMAETPDWVDKQLDENSARRNHQQKLNIQVILGNPPYSAGQESANDNNANIAYPKLDERIRRTYAERSEATNKNALYDSYIRAIRWSSDRIKDRGVIGFVTNGGFLEANTADGLRQCLVAEFSQLYIFHLRGNQRTSGERSRKEGGKIFGSGSRAPIAISILVKNPDSKTQGQIHFYDIGDYLTREQKLKIISKLGSIQGITAQHGWQSITPDSFGDWLKQRDPNFDTYISLGDKKNKNAKVVFENYSRGVATSRDAWVYNFSRATLKRNICTTIEFYNSELLRLNNPILINANSISYNLAKISWNLKLIHHLKSHKALSYDDGHIKTALYRPFTKSKLYFDRILNNETNLFPQIFPTQESENWVICLTLAGTKGFSTLITDTLPDLHLIGDAQCFPRYLYEKTAPDTGLFAQESNETQYQRREAITDEALTHFQEYYPELTLSKADIFYYIYGLLHSEEYREKYADNLSKQLPRLPRVKTPEAFSAFVQAGRKLADLHLNYETVALNTTAKLSGKTKNLAISANGVMGGQDRDFYVTQMKFAKTQHETGKLIDDKTTVIYNHGITIEPIPLEAYDYIVNGKPALEWVMERQAVTTDKASGIVNDANDWAIETIKNAKYPLELLLRVITVSLETQAIVRGLPKLEI